jgi:hypothetical protein
MAETLGMLCDKLTIVKLKEYHTEDKNKLKSLASQRNQIQQEIDEYFIKGLQGKIPLYTMTFEANKVYNNSTINLKEVVGSLGEVIGELAHVNCNLWHEQEKVFDFEKVPIEEKNNVVKQLAILNLDRNNCIDKINKIFVEAITSKL